MQASFCTSREGGKGKERGKREELGEKGRKEEEKGKGYVNPITFGGGVFSTPLLVVSSV